MANGVNMEFTILDRNFVAVKMLDVFESFIWTDRYSAYGDFEIELAPTMDNLLYLQTDYYVYSTDTRHTMIIEDIRITSDAEDGNKLIVTGRSLESILERRIIWQQTILNGNFQDGIRALLNLNVINPLDGGRKISNFIFEYSNDPAITQLTIDSQFTGTNLYDTIKQLCDVHNIGFRVLLSPENKFVFSLYSGVDRSYNQFINPYVIFSPSFDNLINSNYFSSKRELKTINLVAGEGEGLARRTAQVQIPSGAGIELDRREMYTDARDISSNSGEIDYYSYYLLLVQRGRDYLAENVIVKAFEGNVDTLHKFIFDKDFFMGDIIQIENEFGIESTSRVTEVVRSRDIDGFQIFPTFTTIE